MTHTWFGPPGSHDTPIVFHTSAWRQGWIAEQVDDHWEVYYTPTERMRIGADGSLSFGGPEPYVFQTREWAELCAKRLNSLDAAFGRGPSGTRLDMSGNLGIGTTSPSYKLVVNGPQFRPIVSVGDSGIEHIDLPAIVGIWWRGTSIHRVLKRLMWGERGQA